MPPRPAILARTVVPAPLRVVFSLVIGAVGVDLAVAGFRSHGIGLSLAAWAVLVALLAAAPPRAAGRGPAVFFSALVVVFGWFWFARSSAVISPIAMLAAFGSLVALAAFGRRGGLFDVTSAALVTRAVFFIEDALLGLPWAAHPAIDRARRGRADPTTGAPDIDSAWPVRILGLALAIPVAATIVGLLAWGDPVFASLFDIGLDGRQVARYVGFGLGGAATVAMLARHATADEQRGDVAAEAPATLGNTIIATLAAVFALFAASRLLSLTGAAERIAHEKGLTYAEYARSGFFQLLGAAAISFGVLALVGAACRTGTPSQLRWRTGLGLLNAVLVETLVVDAIWRLHLYEQAYGWTLLRLHSTWFAMWVGVAFLIVGASYTGLWRNRRWLLAAIACFAFVGLAGATLVNSEAIVAKRNMTGPTDLSSERRDGGTDLDYLVELGDDAVPTIVDNLDGVDDAARDELLGRLCDRPVGANSGLSYNLARARAKDALAGRCPDETPSR